MGILVVAVGAAAGFAGLGFTYYRFGAIQLARLVLWIGALLPLAYTQAQTTQTLATGSISTLQSLRGLLPALCILLARMLTRPIKRPLGRVEWFVVLYLSLAVTSTAWSISPKQTLLKAIVLILGFLCLWGLVRRYDSPKLAIQGLASFTHCTLLIVALEVLVLRGKAFQAGRLQSVFPQIGADVLGTLTVVGILALFLKQGPQILISTRAALPTCRDLLFGAPRHAYSECPHLRRNSDRGGDDLAGSSLEKSLSRVTLIHADRTGLCCARRSCSRKLSPPRRGRLDLFDAQRQDRTVV